ncbi:sensor histidine kinase [Poriferisphaera sp. WC338]|uniref:sensor histidine kinase n=1 Tax=Poriferisphaera sp. WC338 TaxID=3425129 RepID=UPI003D819CBC
MKPDDSNAAPKPAAAHSSSEAAQVLMHLQNLEEQLAVVREGLAHSHRLVTLGTISSVIAHEFNNILTPMISYSQMALANPDDTEFMKKALGRTLDSSKRAAEIISSLLNFAREEDQASHIANIKDAIDGALACLAREPKKDGIHLEVDVDAELYAAISPVHLQQVLLNLILNARKVLLQSGGTITIRTSSEDDRVRLAITDTGPGVPEDIRETLFDPFVTRSTTTSDEAPKGTGLGLHICRQLIEEAGGTITFTLGQGAEKAQTVLGSEFTINIRAASPLIAEEHSTPTAAGYKQAS